MFIATSRRRRALLRFAAVAVVAVLATACGGSGGGGSGSSKVLSEIDYFTAGGSDTAMKWYIKKFEAAHPGVTVRREAVPFANLITKVLQDASAQNMPNIVMLDNPNVPEVAATGQLRQFDKLSGFTTDGYYPGDMKECQFQSHYYCYPIGTNSVAIFYNKKMLDAAGVQPPKTWQDLVAAAKKLTKGDVHGIAFDATADEQSTWQLEPFMWTNGAQITKVDSPQAVQALQLWQTLVQNGSASKRVLQLGQSPDLAQEFIKKRAAMIENGPWIFPLLDQAGLKYDVDYGIVPIPVRVPGQTVQVPLGGETFTLGDSGNAEQKKLAWEFVKGMQDPATMLHITQLMYYLPTKPAVTAKLLKKGPKYQVFANETLHAHARTEVLGVKYPKVSEAIWTAIQSTLTGAQKPQQALNTAQSKISSIVG